MLWANPDSLVMDVFLVEEAHDVEVKKKEDEEEKEDEEISRCDDSASSSSYNEGNKVDEEEDDHVSDASSNDHQCTGYSISGDHEEEEDKHLDLLNVPRKGELEIGKSDFAPLFNDYSADDSWDNIATQRQDFALD